MFLGQPGVLEARQRIILRMRAFADTAGYTSVKTEITQFTGYLCDPGRHHKPGCANRLRDARRAGPA